MLVDPRAATRTPPSVPSDRRWPGTLGRVNRFDLQRFVDAQDAAGTYDAALAELLAGGKRSHWMWFVFPQVAGLGHSATAQRYAVSGLAEARAYLAHPVLGPRLVACARALTGLQATDPVEVLGPVDAQKLQSSMTLFARADPHEAVFQDVLDQYFEGSPDDATTRRV
jgi:uncharacterized protein (DUF1810 family)